MKNIAKKTILIITLLSILFDCISIYIFADDSNGTSGDGDINDAYSCWYNLNDYGWRVSLYVSKYFGLTDDEFKKLSLTEDYYCIGSIDITNYAFISTDTLCGKLNKIDYLNGNSITLSDNSIPTVYKGCPGIPLVTPNANIESVNTYFLQNTTLLKILNSLAIKYNISDAFSLVKNLQFSYKYKDKNGTDCYFTQTGVQWGESHILPTGDRTNYVPWIIVYEPMVCTHFNDNSAPVFFTATEYALTQGVYYNWQTVKSDSKNTYTNKEGVTYFTGKLTPRCMQSMALKNLAASVTLEKSWFGYSLSTIQSNKFWPTDDIIETGGWGMGYLSSKSYQDIQKEITTKDLSMNLVSYNEYDYGEEVITSFKIQNNQSSGIFTSDGIKAKFRTYDSKGNTIFEEESDNIIIAPDEDTFVWFKWQMPDSGQVTLEAELVSQNALLIQSTKLTHKVKIYDQLSSHCPEPGFNDVNPGITTLIPRYSEADTKTWYYWTYTNNQFVKHENSLTVSASVTIKPDSRIQKVQYKNNNIAMRSGYGIEAEGTISIDSSNVGYSNNVVVAGAKCIYLFGEYNWSAIRNKYEDADYVNGKYVLPCNVDADNARIHYVPLWFPDGDKNYFVVMKVGHIYTPGGTIDAQAVSNGISIDGSLYDDWKVVH